MRIKVLSGGRKSIELPLSDAELNFQMKRIGIEEIVPVCRLVEASEKDNPLCKFEGQTVKMDEVNFFAKRLDCFTEYERKVLYSYALKACLYDRSLKTTLTPIVAKLSDMRIVNAELEYMVMEPRKEFITMVVLVVGNIPLLYFLNKDWYHTLMHTVVGQIMLSIAGIIIFVSTAHVIRLTKPIEYRS